ncbi:VOC family protein [Sphingobium boeckii]|uniref:Catechol 2,3-dioxygenase-like lactoylglutathione lyase family enzyme n=1 Tax=Sphingobium boeckii TaxID=1082345 RepID=A0A7W9AFW7_9SPHN|nr:VOC family protein [Sphingobium boeckii]MBB5684777.1 catechol 2,3-dioxygenase-like lactoylglutathione lyase family enzyme [Sphingobium boeckii]
MTARSSIRDITGVLTMFYYRDLAAAADWYETRIGFERVMDTENFVVLRIFQSSHLALVTDGFGSQSPIEGANKGALLSIQTADLERWQRHLHDRGVEGAELGLGAGCGGRTIEFKVRDPEGYTLEFFQWIA